MAPRRSPVVPQRTGLPLIDPSRHSFPSPEGSATSPAKARHVTETCLVGHTANKHQPRDGVISLGKVLSRPSPSEFCCMALQRLHTRGRSEGKAAWAGQWAASSGKKRLSRWRNIRPAQVTGGAQQGRHLGESASPEDGSRWARGASDDKSQRALLKGAEARLSLHLPIEPRRPGVWDAEIVPPGDGAERGSRFLGEMR